MGKSANKRWRESGTTLPFNEWIEKDNHKRASMKDEKSFFPFVKDAHDAFGVTADLQNATTAITSPGLGVKTTEDKTKILGLNKGILIFSVALIAVSVGIVVYKRMKKNN